MTNDGFKCQAIASVARFRKRDGNQSPNTLEAKIAFDADKLIASGQSESDTVPLRRTSGARVHNTESEALNSKSYSVNDSGIPRIPGKIEECPPENAYRTGRKLAEKDEFMLAFSMAETRKPRIDECQSFQKQYEKDAPVWQNGFGGDRGAKGFSFLQVRIGGFWDWD